jgi:hypothetical protein
LLTAILVASSVPTAAALKRFRHAQLLLLSVSCEAASVEVVLPESMLLLRGVVVACLCPGRRRTLLHLLLRQWRVGVGCAVPEPFESYQVQQRCSPVFVTMVGHKRFANQGAPPKPIVPPTGHQWGVQREQLVLADSGEIGLDEGSTIFESKHAVRTTHSPAYRLNTVTMRTKRLESERTLGRKTACRWSNCRVPAQRWKQAAARIKRVDSVTFHDDAKTATKNALLMFVGPPTGTTSCTPSADSTRCAGDT